MIKYALTAATFKGEMLNCKCHTATHCMCCVKCGRQVQFHLETSVFGCLWSLTLIWLCCFLIIAFRQLLVIVSSVIIVTFSNVYGYLHLALDSELMLKLKILNASCVHREPVHRFAVNKVNLFSFNVDAVLFTLSVWLIQSSWPHTESTDTNRCRYEWFG